MKNTQGALLEVLKAAGVCSWSNERLAQAVGVSSRTVSRHLAVLEQAGLIRILRYSPNQGGPGSDPVGRKIYIAEEKRAEP